MGAIGASRQWRPRLWLWVALILVLAAFLRFYRLGEQSLWYDEGWSAHVAESSFSEALRLPSSPGHTHPPLYYLLLWGWVRVFSASDCAVRALSALLGVLVCALGWTYGVAIGRRSVGLLGSFLLAISAPLIVYSQEARMYMLLVALYGLTLVLHLLALRKEAWPTPHLVGLALTEAALAYTHYLGVIALAGIAFAYLLLWMIRRMRSGEKSSWPWRWLAAQIAALLLYLPYLPTALAPASGHATLGALPPTLPGFLRETWAFLIGGHLALWGRDALFPYLAVVAAVVALVAVVTAMVQRHSRRRAAFLALAALTSLVLTYGIMRIRPGYHPRYLLFLVVPLVYLIAEGAAGLRTSGKVWRLLAVLLLACLCIASGYAFHRLWEDTYYHRDNARSVAEYLEGTIDEDTTVACDVEDWALERYLAKRSVHLEFADLTGGQESGHIGFYDSAQVTLVSWHQGTSDHGQYLPYALEKQGVLVSKREMEGYLVRTYVADAFDVAMADSRPAARIGPLVLQRIEYEAATAADEAVTVALQWGVAAPHALPLKVALSLDDSVGHELSRTDTILLDYQGASSEKWSQSHSVRTYHVLPLFAAAPSGPAALVVRLYEQGQATALNVLDAAGAPAGQELRFGSLKLLPSRRFGIQRDLPQEIEVHELEEGPQPLCGQKLLAASIDRQGLDPGESVQVKLLWRLEGAPSLGLPSAILTSRGLVLAAVESSATQAGSALGKGLLLDWRDLGVPVDAPPGEAEITLRGGQHAVTIGTVEIGSVPRIMEPPSVEVRGGASLGGVAELYGSDATPAQVPFGEPLTVTLQWRALASGVSRYTVFVHLLSLDGRVIAQHDGEPAQGMRPTSGWLAGEYVADTHTLVWGDSVYQGEAHVEVGLYDSATGARLKTNAGDSQVYLPGSIMVHHPKP